MELKVVSILGTIIVMFLVTEAWTLPMDTPEAHGEQDANVAADKRPKYMDTRDLSAFKDLVLYTMEEFVQVNDSLQLGTYCYSRLAEEGRINPELLVPKTETAPEGAMERRGRHLGLCVRRRGSTLTPYPCWKADSE